MVHELYWIITLVFSLVLGIILYQEYSIVKKDNANKDYRNLLIWVLIFCLQDSLWGLASSTIINNKLLFISSTIFHMSTVLTTYFWLNYVLTYLSNNRFKHIYLGIDKIIILFQIILLIINIFEPTIFYIENGIYYTAKYRPIAFFNQYVVYLLIGIVSIYLAITRIKEERYKYFSVLLFSIAQILLGIFQLMFPELPMYSIGYFIGSFIICIFVISKERDELIKLQYEKQVDNERKISKTDKLTGLYNRRAYEEEINAIKNNIPDNFIYISIDVNGLKNINDTLGHLAGDELIKGAADCLKNSLENYGNIYRIGGDEFAALIYANEMELPNIKNDIEEITNNWKGTIVNELDISYGCASKVEYKNNNITELIKQADKKMYKAKDEYYNKKGIDRRGKRAAYSILCESYTKILKINLTTDSFKIIKVISEEMDKEKGYSEKITEWLYNFAVSGLVHEDDKDL